ncbi:transporter [Leucobacter coleopterorum]|uniref:Transporter n=1 Tax=Leucobacter coleopterorum TaxID=2714933 RepID=A0ABX6JXT3_9MICO|nr:transporter [Leucobacter coleopterorum]QIM18766.1 transporter [Leucobacter coleopterorum]
MAESFLTSVGSPRADSSESAGTGALARIRVLVALRFVVVWNTLKRHPWQLVGAILGALYGLGILMVAVVGLVGLAFAPADLTRTVLVLVGSAIVIVWMVGPILFSGMDRTLDPARFATLPITPSVQVAGIAAASLFGIPGIVTLLVSALTAVAWFKAPIAAVAAILLAPVAALTCVLGCQLVTTVVSRAATSRRFREVIGGLLILLLVLIGPIMMVVGSGISSLAESLPAIAEVFSWSPFGAVWAVPADLAVAHWIPAVVKLVIAIATALLLAIAWRTLYFASLGTVVSGSRSRGSTGAGWFGRFPGTPRGAIAARALTYWLRDPRYLQSLIVVFVMPIVFGVLASNTELAILLPGSTVLVATFLSLGTFTDISYDGTAFSLHLLRGVRGIDDRAGRIWANAIVAVPILLVVAISTTAIAGRFDQLPTLLGLTASVTLGGFGVASVCSALLVMPVAQSGENPFVSKPGAAMLSMLGMAGSYGALALISLPAIGFAIAAGITDEPWLAWTTLGVGLFVGSVACLLGVRLGAAIFDRRAPELYVRVVAQN